MKLSIIIPVYNEKTTILTVLEQINELNLYDNCEKEIIIVDDNSFDGTKELLKNAEKKQKFDNCRYIYKEKNSGKGDSQRIAIPMCSGDFTIIQDADLEYNIKNINDLLKLLVKNNFDAVFGFRKLKNVKFFSLYFVFHRIAVMTLTILTNILYLSKIKDVATCYRLIKTSILKELKIKGKGFEYDFSMINKLLKKTKNIGQMQIEYNNRSFKEGKKNTWIVGFYAIKRILLDRFVD